MNKKFERGQVWRAKKPRNSNGLVNDRMILHIDSTGAVQYDGPAVQRGCHYPKVTQDIFEKWAGRQVKEELPEGEWAAWDFQDPEKNK
ncbi:MAG: hypothetical protein ACRYG5_10015 [Janthinobacterium lividum]